MVGGKEKKGDTLKRPDAMSYIICVCNMHIYTHTHPRVAIEEAMDELAVEDGNGAARRAASAAASISPRHKIQGQWCYATTL